MKIKLLFLSLIFLATGGSLFGQIKTITGGGYQNPDGSICSGCTLTLQLVTDAVVNGTGQIAPKLRTYTLDASGNVPANSTLWGNDQLQPNGTTYKATLSAVGGGQIWGPEYFSISGNSPINLAQLIPVANPAVYFSNPAVTNLSNTFTGANTFTGSLTVSGTGTFTGATTVKSFSNMQYISAPVNASTSDQGWAGTDPCSWHEAAKGALPTTGGFVDGRGLIGTGYNNCAATFTVGGLNTKPEEFDIGGVNIVVPATVIINGGSTLKGLAPNANGPFPTRIIAKSGTFPTSSTLIQFDNTQINEGIRLFDMQVDCVGITGCTTLDTGQAQEHTRIQGVWFAGWMNHCIMTQPASPTENWSAEQIVCAPASAAPGTATGIVLNPTADHFWLNNVSFASSAASPIAADIVCNGCSTGAGTLHLEDATDGWQANSGAGVNGGSSSINEIDCLANVTNCVHIKSGFAGSLYIGAIDTLNASSPVSFLIDAGVVGTNAVTCNDKAVGDFYINTTQAQPILRSSCSNVPNQYLSSGSAGVNGFLTPNGQGLNIIDNTSGHARTIALGNNVVALDSYGFFDKNASANGLYCFWTGGKVCNFPGSIVPQTAGGADVGATGSPWGNLWLGTAGTNNFKFQPAATAAARVISIPDPLGNTTLPLTIASGAQALNTASVTTATCDGGVAATATGTLSTDRVDWSFNAAPTATNKYGAFLVVYAVPSSNTVTFYTCNPSATTSTPTAMTVNWSVRRP